MLQKRTHLWECKVNEETSLCEHSNESIEINTLNTNDDMSIYWAMKSSYNKRASMTYELNVMELYTDHR